MRILVRFVFLFLICIPVYAQSIPTKPDNYVNDYAHILSIETINQLNQELKAYEQQTSNQIVVAIFPGDLQTSIEDFSTQLENQWKVGQKEKDNGVLLVIFPKEKQLRIEVGYGLEGAIPDTLADNIIRTDIVPSFKNGNYGQGVINGVHAIMKASQGEYTNSSSQSSILSTFVALFFFLLVGFMMGAFIGPIFALAFCIMSLGMLWGFIAWGFAFVLYLAIYHLVPAHYRHEKKWKMFAGGFRNQKSSGSGNSSSSSSGSSFSSGGGSSGGGGASGRW